MLDRFCRSDRLKYSADCITARMRCQHRSAGRDLAGHAERGDDEQLPNGAALLAKRRPATASNGSSEPTRPPAVNLNVRRGPVWALLLLFAAATAISAAPAAEPAPAATSKAQPATNARNGLEPADAPPLTHYRGREIAVTMHYLGAPWLTREEREREEDCGTLLTALHVSPGQTICDLGCGNGFYTLPLAELTGEQGLVYAVDIQREMLEMLAERAKDGGVANLRPILGTAVDPRLPAKSVDLVLLVDVYHELSNPEEILRAIRTSLAPGGRMVLVEFRLEDPNVPIKLLHKMSKQQILAEIVPNGFRLVEQFDKLPWQHVMFFERDEGEPTAKNQP